MKKSIVILLVLVFLVLVCIGVVGCNDQQFAQETLAHHIKTYGPNKFMAETSFSFGRFFWADLGEIRYGKTKHEPILVFNEHAVLDATLEKLREVLENHKEEMIATTKYEVAGLETAFCSSRLATMITDGFHAVMGFNDESFDRYAKGSWIEGPGEGWYVQYAMVHDVYDIGDYRVIYASGVENSLCFFTMLKKEGSMIIVFRTDIMGYGSHFIEELFAIITPEERHEIAQYYQEVHKEIVTSWLEN